MTHPMPGAIRLILLITTQTHNPIMKELTPIFRNLVLAFAVAATWLYVPTASAAIISVDFLAAASQAITGTYGISSQNTVVAGWMNLTQANNYISLPFSDGTASTVNLTGTSVPGWATGNGGYTGTPLVGGKAVYGTTSAANRPTFTLANMITNFPNGYKVIVYISGYLNVADAYISNGITSFYYRSATNSTEVTSVVSAGLYQTTQTTDLGNYKNPLAQYAVFGGSGLLTNDTMTFTLGGTSVGSGAWIAGFQIVGDSAPELTARIWSGNVNNDWDTTTQNWTNNITGSAYYAEGDPVTFNDQAVAASPTVNLTATRSPSGVMVNATKDYTFTGSDITGSASLTKKGSGALTLSNANTYTGDTIISAGTLKVGNGSAIPNGAAYGNVSIASGATLDLNGFSAGVNGLTGSGTVDDTGTAATLTVGLNNDSTTFSGTIQGATALTKQGTNAITLTGNSSHTGVTTVAQGVLVLSPVSGFSGSSALAVSNGATLGVSVTNGSGLYTSGNMSLNGGVALSIDYGNASTTGSAVPITTSGTLDLNGVSQIAINGNSFSIGSYTLISYSSKTGGGSISSVPASLPSGMAATIQDTGSAIVLNVTFPSIQSLGYTYGDGGVWATNAGTAYWNLGTAAYSEYPGGLGDAVTFGTNYNGFTLSGGTVSLTTDVHPYSIFASGSYTLNGPGRITGATGFQLAGVPGATFTLNNTNTYTGITTISSGTLQINNGSALGSTAGATVVAAGGSLALSNGIALAGEPIILNGNGTAANNGALRTVYADYPVTLASPITLGSTARIRVADGGQLIITSPITDNGSNYTVFLHADQTNSVIRLNSANNVAGNLTVYGSSAPRGLISFGVDNVFPNSSLAIGGGLLDLNGKNQAFAGLLAGFNPQLGVVTNSSTTPSTLTINYSGTNSAQMQSAIGGLVNIVKEGTGLQSFGGGAGIIHTYTGTTTINNGILGLAADVSQVTNNWIVNSGGTLRGSATIGGPVTVNSGGTIYAGYATNSIGTLTISNNLTLAGNTIVAVDKDVSPSNSVINVSSTLAYGGTLTIYNIGTNALVAGDTFTIFPPGGTGSFSSIVSDPGVTWSFNNGVLTVVSVGPPTAPTLGYTALGGGVLQFNWTGAYKLQWQTNALDTGLSTNWVDYPDKNNPVNVTNNPATPATFFRLNSL